MTAPAMKMPPPSALPAAAAANPPAASAVRAMASAMRAALRAMPRSALVADDPHEEIDDHAERDQPGHAGAPKPVRGHGRHGRAGEQADAHGAGETPAAAA